MWFDGTYIQQEGNQASRSGVLIRFPPYANGAFSHLFDDNNVKEYADESLKPVFKYARGVRFYVGACVVEQPNGEYIIKNQRHTVTL